MLRTMMKSKIHGATVTDANLRYMGSITIDRALMEAADIFPNERVQVVNLNNGSRVETYVMEGAPGSGVICMNGPAARTAQPGDSVHIISYAVMESSAAKMYRPTVVFLQGKNSIVRPSPDTEAV